MNSTIEFEVVTYNLPPEFETYNHVFVTEEEKGIVAFNDHGIQVSDDQTANENLIWSVGEQPDFGTIEINQMVQI